MGRTYGPAAVDWEQRVDFDRLRRERLARAKGLLEQSELGALLCFDMANIRYMTATHIGTWASRQADPLLRCCRRAPTRRLGLRLGRAPSPALLPVARRGRSRAGISTMRGAMSPRAGRAETVADKIAVELNERGLLGEPLGIDVVEPPVLFALQKEGIEVVDGQQLMQRRA